MNINITASQLIKTHAGRLVLVEELMNMGLIKTPEEYLSILNGDFSIFQKRQNYRKIKEKLGVK